MSPKHLSLSFFFITTLLSSACGDEGSSGPTPSPPDLVPRASAVMRSVYDASVTSVCGFIHDCSSDEEREELTQIFEQLGVRGGLGADAAECVENLGVFYLESAGDRVCEATAEAIVALEPEATGCATALEAVPASCDQTFDDLSEAVDGVLQGPACAELAAGLEAIGEDACAAPESP